MLHFLAFEAILKVCLQLPSHVGNDVEKGYENHCDDGNYEMVISKSTDIFTSTLHSWCEFEVDVLVPGT